MNFDNQTPVDTLMGQLLAFIMMFQKKIENLRCRLAGNQQFHTRLAFQALDHSHKNQINSQVLTGILQRGIGDQHQHCSQFLKKYSRSGSLTYDEFLKLVTPKSNKTLAQRMLVRSYPRGTILQNYLCQYVLQILGLYVKMTQVTQSLKTSIQYNDELSHLDLIEFFHQRIFDSQSLLTFLRRSTGQGEQYDIDFQDSVYLSYHLTSGNQIQDFTDLDIKQLICPTDMNFKRPSLARQKYYQQTIYQAQPLSQTQSLNFLSKTYQKMYNKKPLFNKKENADKIMTKPEKYQYPIVTNLSAQGTERRQEGHSYSNLYIDNFTHQQGESRLQLNNYLGQNQFSRRQVEVFQDQLSSNGSSLSKASRQSAFDRS